MVLSEWGNNTPCQVKRFVSVSVMYFKLGDFQIVLVTDGSTGLGAYSLQTCLSTSNRRPADHKFPVPFTFPGKLHVVCITTPNDPVLTKSTFYLMNINCQRIKNLFH